MKEYSHRLHETDHASTTCREPHGRVVSPEIIKVPGNPGYVGMSFCGGSLVSSWLVRFEQVRGVGAWLFGRYRLDR